MGTMSGLETSETSCQHTLRNIAEVSFGAESFVFQVAIQKFKDQDI